jgi:hypothetical protein
LDRVGSSCRSERPALNFLRSDVRPTSDHLREIIRGLDVPLATKSCADECGNRIKNILVGRVTLNRYL